MRFITTHLRGSRVYPFFIGCLVSLSVACGANAPDAPISPDQFASHPSQPVAAPAPAQASPGMDPSASSPALPGGAAAGGSQPAPPPSVPSGPSSTKLPAKTLTRGATELAKSGERPAKPNVLILYTGDMSLQVPEGQIGRSIDEAVSIAERFGGYLGGRTNATVKLKIPSGSFREALTEVEKLGVVGHENINADDVTAEFHDLEVRLENLKATRKRVEEFLARATTLADMLTVQRELERIAAEMDTISGRLRFLREHTAFSTLTISLTAIAKPTPVVAAEPPPPPPAPPARTVDLPVPWFATLGIGPLLTLPTKK